MGRRNKVDVESPLLLKGQHGGSQFILGYGASLPLPAQLVILAEEAFEVASREKDCSRSTTWLPAMAVPAVGIPAQNRLLTQVEQSVGKRGLDSSITEAFLSLCPVDTALSGAKRTAFVMRRQMIQGFVQATELSCNVHTVRASLVQRNL